ncbi:hypothetical protein ACJIZ3_009131 [Penstemon smallii]|uniref:Uncharacterized protein n=1 Tax=Penstemon smallii TaxID=265156 RepID=A0ABD3TBP9_9LAMI
MTNTMAFAISTPTSSLFHSSSTVKPSSICGFSNSAISIPKNVIFQQVKGIPQLGFTPFSQWNGLKNLGISNSQYSVKIEKKRKCKGKGVYASLFGVGAPEALVIGVVALLVFGPKGLAEVARNLGKTLRQFQPTIRELQEVSREFKSTLEREIGLDDIDNVPVPKSNRSNTIKPTPDDSGTNVELNGSPSESGEVANDDSGKVSGFRLKETLAQLQKEQEEEREREEKEKEEKELQTQSESPPPSQDTPEAVDTLQESTVSAEITTPYESPESNALQEAASTVPSAPAPKLETET